MGDRADTASDLYAVRLYRGRGVHRRLSAGRAAPVFIVRRHEKGGGRVKGKGDMAETRTFDVGIVVPIMRDGAVHRV